jgi:polysaccharide biosynthesis/export protein
LTVSFRWGAGLLFASMIGAGTVHAQAEPPGATPPPVESSAAGQNPLLDVPIERGAYHLGGGDGVTLSIFGDRNHHADLTVAPEGALVLPGIGVAHVGGLTVEAAESVVRREVLRLYRNVDVRLTLTSVRRFRVFVVGDVPSPGSREVSAVTRASELVPGESPHMIRRSVVVRRAGGDSVVVDLARFRLLGDLQANPTLREGDILVVPSTLGVVDVVGRIAHPGRFEHRPGETLAELLRLAAGGGPLPPDAADTIRVTRITGVGAREEHRFTRAEALGAAGEAFPLEPFDAVYIAATANFAAAPTASVQGEVMHPGIYPVVPGETTVRELVQRAGGFTPDASLLGATLRRGAWRASDAGLARLESLRPELLSREERRILQVRSQADEGTVVLDFERLFEGGGHDEPVEAGDELVVPRRRDDVMVLGAVMNPGLLHYSAGATGEDFIRLAGGYSRRAARRDVVVLRARTGARVSVAESGRLEPGDVIVVPYQERTDLLQVLQTASTVASLVASLILTIRLVR